MKLLHFAICLFISFIFHSCDRTPNCGDPNKIDKHFESNEISGFWQKDTIKYFLNSKDTLLFMGSNTQKIPKLIEICDNGCTMGNGCTDTWQINQRTSSLKNQNNKFFIIFTSSRVSDKDNLPFVENFYVYGIESMYFSTTSAYAVNPITDKAIHGGMVQLFDTIEIAGEIYESVKMYKCYDYYNNVFIGELYVSGDSILKFKNLTSGDTYEIIK